ncbi:MAG: ABC transporter permease [Gemmatimonadota bacterium]|nr:ABC transporter permease [Gemmatimonadota bacterium]
MARATNPRGTNRPAPPRLSGAILERFSRLRYTGALLGDLEEEYHDRLGEGRGTFRARMWYRREVFRSLPSLAAHAFRAACARRRNLKRGDSWMQSLLQDIRFGLRSMRRNLGLAAVIIVTLALGIGANTVLYSVVDGLILNPFPFPDGDRLVTVGTEYPKLGSQLNFVEHMSPAEYVDIRDNAETLENIAAWDMGNRQVSWGELNDNVFTGFFWGDAFDALGLAPIRGRGMTLEETVAGEPVAVISHRLWQTRFGEDPDLVGGTIGVNGNPFTVVGIMPPRSELYGMDLWIPMGVSTDVFPRQARQFQIIARIADGEDLESVNAELELLARRTEMEYAELEEYQGWRMTAATWTDANVRTIKPAGYVLLGAVSFVLLIVCSNVASLLLARSSTRRQEMAVRAAMGAGRGRLMRQVLTESVGLAVVSGALGVALAYFGTGAVADIVAGIPFVAGAVELNTRVLVFAVVVSMAAGVLFGLLPAIQDSAAGLGSTLKTEGTANTGGAGRLRLQRALVSVEVALALVLLIGGGLLINSFARLTRVDTGFEPEGVLSMRLTLPWEEYDDVAIGSFFQNLEEQVGGIPGVEAVGRGAQFPPIAFAYRRLATEDLEVTDEGQLPVAMTTLSSPGYLEALGIPLLGGRWFDDTDTPGSELVAVVNEAAVARMFPEGDAIGSRLRVGDDDESPWLRVVGVVGNTLNNGLDQPAFPEVFANHRQVPGWSNQLFLLVRTSVEPYGVLPAIRDVVRSIDADQPVYAIRTVEEALAASTAPRRVAANVLTVFAGFALILAAVGIFAVVAFAVGARTREIGLRVALGAGARQVRMLVIRQALVPVVIGTLIGLGSALALSRLMSGLLFEVSGTDPLTLTAVTLVFGVVALVASYVPALRASRLDPVEALRVD